MNEPATADAVVDDIQIETSGVFDAPESSSTQTEAAVEATTDADAALSADPGDEDDQAVQTTADGKPKRKSLQARIDREVSFRRQAERERDEYRARVEAAERAQAQPRQPERTEPRAPQYLTGQPPSEDEIGTTYKDYPEFIRAVARFEYNEARAMDEQRQQMAARAERHSSHARTFADRIAKAEESNPNFWKGISPAIAALAPSSAHDPRALESAAQAARQGHPDAQAFLNQIEIADIVFDSDVSAELMAHLSANTQQFQRLLTLPPRQLVREMGKLEASFSRPAAAHSGPAPKMPPVSQAAPPIKPVGTTASAETLDPLADDLDIDTHIKVMNAKERKNARR